MSEDAHEVNPLREGERADGYKPPSGKPRPTNPPPSEGNPQKQPVDRAAGGGMSKEELMADMEKHREQMRQRVANTKACTEEVLAVLRKYRPHPIDLHGESVGNLPFRPEAVCAAAIRYFAVGGIIELYLDWTVEAYYAYEIVGALDWAERIYGKLVEQGFSRDNPFDYNDDDNRAFVVDMGGPLAFCLEDQNTRFLFIIAENAISKMFRCVRYWDVFDPEHSSFDHDQFEGVELALRSADWIHQNYSDCTAANPGGGRYRPDRPSLDWFVGKKLTDPLSQTIGYGDCRDSWHVFNIETREEGMPGSKDDQIMHRVSDITLALFQINSCWTCLTEDEKAGRLK